MSINEDIKFFDEYFDSPLATPMAKMAWENIRNALEEYRNTPLCDAFIDLAGQRRCRAGFDL